jgi:FkbM family methyltransferase
MRRMSAKSWVWEHAKTTLRRRGIEISGSRWSVRQRRQSMLSYYGIDVLLDVGANTGQYATEVRGAGYTGVIHSYEPLSGPFRELEAACSTDAAWHAHRVAVGDRTGSIAINISEATKFSSALPLVERASLESPDAAYVGSEEAPLDTLDNLVADITAGNLGLKIDVQGFEGSVLDGGTKTLDRVHFLEMELSPRPVYEGQMLMLEALERLDRLGFVLSCTENIYPVPRTGRAWQFNGIFIRE